MSVGGRIVEKLPMVLTEGEDLTFRKEVVRYGVMDGNEETCVFAEPATVEPNCGDEIWWQSGRIYFDGDRQHLKKVGYSFPAPWSS